MTIIHDATEARKAHRLAKADEEIAGFYTANVGLAGKGFEGGGQSAFNSHRAHESKLRAMKWLERGRGSREWYDSVAATLGQLTIDMRVRLALVYTPHSWPTWLADALSPGWGGGSFVALAATLPRAATAAEGRKPGTSILGWFSERGRGSNDALWKKLKDDCMTLRLQALEAYDPVRVRRVKADDMAEREAKRKREEANQERLAAELGASRRRYAERLDRRIRRGRAA